MIALVFLLTSIVGACGSAAPASTPTPTSQTAASTPAAVTFANPNLLVDTEWLAQHLNDPNVRVVDVRKADAFKSGHIKNSVNLDTMDSKGSMYDQTSQTQWIVLPKDKFESLLSDLGTDKDTIVVAVDDAKMLWASRFFWTLEYYGHGDGKARVLDGGLKKWQAENRELTTDVAQVQKIALVTHQAIPARIALKQQIIDWIGNKNTAILATIPESEYKGGNAKNHLKGGHIPGALQLDWTENLTSGDVPVFKSAAELSQMYEKLGITKDKNVVLY